MTGELVLIALGTLASEDLTLAATGVLIAQGKLGFPQGMAACVAGIFTGDMLIYVAGRTLGLQARRWSVFARMASAERVERGAAFLNRRGATAVLLSRFTPGLRFPTYFAAGLLRTRIGLFAGYFLLASLIWTPLFLGVTGWLSGTLFHHRAAGLAAVGSVVALVAATQSAVRHSRNWIGRWKRVMRWEFWPAWAVYLPLIPYLVYLAARHRSLTLFTAANPGIASGGFVGESKSGILRELAQEPDLTPPFETILWTSAPAQREAQAIEFANIHGFPIVLKPDTGERGAGVAIARSQDEVARYFDTVWGDIIVQQYVPGVEFGIFYYRYPQESRGRIVSITEKHFPVMIGDGRRTLRELILSDSRAVCQAETYCALTRHDVDAVPAAGEQVQLVELGSHCRGAIFLNGARHKTPTLEDAIERLSQAHKGFYFGRFDVRAASIESLRAGQFSAIELNGVSAEATHIYDPAVSIVAAYRTMADLWRVAFEIGAANRRAGCEPMPVREFVRLIRRRRNAD